MTNLTLEEKQELIRMALAAREKAYAPYSNFMVGAAPVSYTHLEARTFLRAVKAAPPPYVPLVFRSS